MAKQHNFSFRNTLIDTVRLHIRELFKSRTIRKQLKGIILKSRYRAQRFIFRSRSINNSKKDLSEALNEFQNSQSKEIILALSYIQEIKIVSQAKKRFYEIDRLKSYIKRLVEENKILQCSCQCGQQIVVKQNQKSNKILLPPKVQTTFTKKEIKLPTNTYNLEQAEEYAEAVFNKQIVFRNPIQANSALSLQSRSQTCSPRSEFLSNGLSQDNTFKSVRSNIHDRLYQESFGKKQKQEQIELQKEFKELKDCTFRPDLSLTAGKNLSQISQNDLQSNVYDRLSCTYNKLKSEDSSEKDQYELKDCTFRPDISLTNTLSRKANETFAQLHNDYEKKQNYLRAKQIQQSNLEIKECTFQPSILGSSIRKNIQQEELSNNQAISQKVYDRLYSQFQTNQTNRAKQEKIVQEEALKECTFIPQISGQSRSTKASINQRNTSNPPLQTFDRLYNHRETQEHMLNNLKKIVEQEQKLKLEKSIPDYILRKKKNYIRSNSSEAFERLYEDSKKKKQKQDQAKEDLMKEQGVSFNPKINKLSQQMTVQKEKEESLKEHQKQSKSQIKQRPYVQSSQFEEFKKNRNFSSKRQDIQQKTNQQNQQIQEGMKKDAIQKVREEFQRWKLKQDQDAMEFSASKDRQLIPKMVQAKTFQDTQLIQHMYLKKGKESQDYEQPQVEVKSNVKELLNCEEQNDQYDIHQNQRQIQQQLANQELIQFQQSNQENAYQQKYSYSYAYQVTRKKDSNNQSEEQQQETKQKIQQGIQMPKETYKYRSITYSEQKQKTNEFQTPDQNMSENEQQQEEEQQNYSQIKEERGSNIYEGLFNKFY